MLNAEVRIQSIDYERTFEALFPMLMEMVNGMDGESMPIRLLQKLGETSQNVVTGILRKLSPRHQDQILCQLVSAYQVELCRHMNALLAAKGLGEGIVVQRLQAQACEDEMLLTLQNVDVQYAELLKIEQIQQAIGKAAESSAVGQMYQMFSGSRDGAMSRMISDKVSFLSRQKGTGTVMNFFRGDIEKKALHFLEKKFLPEELGRMVSDFLAEKGIYAEVSAIELTASGGTCVEEGAERLLSKELEFAMVDAVAAYLKEREALAQREGG